MEFNVDKVKKYEAKNSEDVRPLGEVSDGTILEVTAAFTDDGVSYIFTEDGIFATNSPIVAEKLEQIMDTFEEIGTIKIVKKKSKNGRIFTSCIKITN